MVAPHVLAAVICGFLGSVNWTISSALSFPKITSGRLSRRDCGESGSTAGSERATRAYAIGPSGSGIVPIGLAVGATGFLRERSGRTPTRPVHRAIIRSFFWFSVSPFLLGRVKRRYWHLKAQSMRLTRGLRGGGSLSLLSCSCSPSTGLRS